MYKRQLDDLDREYTLEEIAIVTRAGADVTIYDDLADREEMFATPRYVIKGGRVVVRDGGFAETPSGTLLRTFATYDPAVEDVLRAQFEERYTVRFENDPVTEPWLLEPARRVPAGAAR